jgi:KRAB domain-containing zinc finger protein
MNCDMCDYKTNQRKYLITHIENKHFYELKMPCICKICGKQLFNKISLKKHIKKVHSDRECVQCKLSFVRRSDLCSHNKLIHNKTTNNNKFIPKCRVKSELKPFQCKICLKTYKKESDILIHDMMHRQNPTFKCDLCGRKFKKEQDVLNHVNAVHMVNKKYAFSCERCNKSFRNEMQLRMHKTTHAGMYMFA